MNVQEIQNTAVGSLYSDLNPHKIAAFLTDYSNCVARIIEDSEKGEDREVKLALLAINLGSGDASSRLGELLSEPERTWYVFLNGGPNAPYYVIMDMELYLKVGYEGHMAPIFSNREFAQNYFTSMQGYFAPDDWICKATLRELCGKVGRCTNLSINPRSEPLGVMIPASVTEQIAKGLGVRDVVGEWSKQQVLKDAFREQERRKPLLEMDEDTLIAEMRFALTISKYADYFRFAATAYERFPERARSDSGYMIIGQRASENKRALSWAEERIVTHPEDPLSHAYLALALLQIDPEGKLGAAVEHTRAALQLDPENSLAKALQHLNLNKAREAADLGDPEAQFYVGWSYYHGEGVAEDAGEAVRWYRKASDQGYAEAEYVLGLCYSMGKGVPMEATTANELWRKAAAQGHSRAQKLLSKLVAGLQESANEGNVSAQALMGKCHYLGIGGPQDIPNAVKWWSKAANQGDPTAQANLGRMYYYGEGVTQNTDEAMKWTKKAAEQGNDEARVLLSEHLSLAVKTWFIDASQGNPAAQLCLGFCYFSGDGLPKNFSKAAEFARLSADQGNSDAQVLLGNMYSNGHGLPKDNNEAIRWWNKAAEQGHSEARRYLNYYLEHEEEIANNSKDAEILRLTLASAMQGNQKSQIAIGMLYSKGKGVPKDEIEGVKWYRKAAEQGNAFGQCSLGKCYARGIGVTRDTMEAICWYRKAADQGLDHAQYSLGISYLEDIGLLPDATEAYKWFMKAAVQGHANAQYRIGLCHYEGIGVSQNAEVAVKWYREAAEQGNVDAQNSLGYCYKNGTGLPQDAIASFNWFRKAALQGSCTAAFTVGLFYTQGYGTTSNKGEAAKWYRIAAEQGSGDAQFLLGLCYSHGEGVHQDADRASFWWQKAADQGNTKAQAILGKS